MGDRSVPLRQWLLENNCRLRASAADFATCGLFDTDIRWQQPVLRELLDLGLQCTEVEPYRRPSTADVVDTLERLSRLLVRHA